MFVDSAAGDMHAEYKRALYNIDLSRKFSKEVLICHEKNVPDDTA
jgi:hypothetical protein